MELQGLDKVIIKSNINRQNGLIIGINHSAYFVEPRGSNFQPLSNGIGVIRIMKKDIESGLININKHTRHELQKIPKRQE